MDYKEKHINFKEMLINGLKDKGMTQKSLATELEVSEATIAKWKKGESNPDSNHLEELCKVLCLDINKAKISLSFDNSEEIARKMFISNFLSINTEDEAAKFIDDLFIDFEMDASNKVSMTYIVKCFAMIALLKTIDEKDLYSEPTKPYDIELFIAELRDTCSPDFFKHYGVYEQIYYETGIMADIKRRIVDLYFIIKDEILNDLEIGNNKYMITIYIRLLIEHIRRKSYESYSHSDKYRFF